MVIKWAILVIKLRPKKCENEGGRAGGMREKKENGKRKEGWKEGGQGNMGRDRESKKETE